MFGGIWRNLVVVGEAGIRNRWRRAEGESPRFPVRPADQLPSEALAERGNWEAGRRVAGFSDSF